jgi:hypothetical protein
MISMIPHALLLISLYAVIEAGYFYQHRSHLHGSSSRGREEDEQARLTKWKRELVSRSSNGREAVDRWIIGWFEPISRPPSQRSGSSRVGIDQVKRGNIESYLAGEAESLDEIDKLMTSAYLPKSIEGRLGRFIEASYTHWCRLRPGACPW